MPFDSLTLESVLFLSLLTILASLPTDPYFYPWYEGPSSYSLHGQGRGSPRFETQFYYGPATQFRGFQLEQRGRNPQDHGGDFHRHHHQEAGGQQAPHRRSDPFPGEEGCGRGNVENVGDSYSSHVNYAETNQKGEKTPKNIRENIEPIFHFEASQKVDQKIGFQEPSRNVRPGGTTKVDHSLKRRIVTPKAGERPEQGRPAKNPSSTNTISTTEKTFRNQTRKGSKRPRPQGGDIIFPDGYTKNFVPRVTKCAKKTTFCEHLGEDYPSDYISQVLKTEGAMFKEFFGTDEVKNPDIAKRINVPEENSLCPYRQEVVYPRAAQNKQDKWLFVINQDQYIQGVTVEVCLNPESRCMLTEGFPLGYTPYCKQKYIERRLVAIGEDGKPHSDSFRLPSCCSCVVKHEAGARMGLPSFPGGLLNSDSSFN